MVLSRSKQFSRFFFLLNLLLPPVRAVALAPGEVLAPDAQQVITIPVQSDIWCLEPDQAMTFWQHYILDMVLEPLVRFETARRIVPAGATHWEPNADKTVWRFYLRQGGKWSNGDSVTANDFVNTYQNYCDPDIRTKLCDVFLEKCPLKNALNVFKRALPIDNLGVKALDEYTLELKFETPMEEKALLTCLTHPMFAPIHLSVLDAIRYQQGASQTYRVRHHAPQAHASGQYLKDELSPEERESFKDDPFVTNGPFTITALRFGTMVKTKKNPYYWDAKNIALQKVNWQFTSFTPRDFWKVALEENWWHLAFLSGAPPCPKDLHDKVFGQWGTEYVAPSTQSTELFILNTRSEKLKDLHVRKAVDILLNRRRIVEELLKCSSIEVQGDPNDAISYSLVPPRSNYGPEYRPEFADWKEEERIQAGEDLLRKAGYTLEQPLTLTLSLPDRGRPTQAFFENLGTNLFLSPLVQVDLKIAKQDEMNSILRQGEFEMTLKRYTCLGEVPESIFKNCKTFGPFGLYAGLSDAIYDDSLNTAIQPVTPAGGFLNETDRYILLRAAEKRLMSQHALLPVLHPKARFVVKNNVRGLAKAHHPLGYPDLRSIYRVGDLPMDSQHLQPERDDREIWRLDDQIEILFSCYPSLWRSGNPHFFGTRRAWMRL